VSRKIECFGDLFVWQKAVEFASEIYLLTGRKGLKTDFGLKNQMRDAAVSVSTNIAEGFERRSRKEYLNFLNIAKGSSGESRSLLHAAFAVGYITSDERYIKVRQGSIFEWVDLESNKCDCQLVGLNPITFPITLFPISPNKKDARGV
jgi:four helix bundle protein